MSQVHEDILHYLYELGYVVKFNKFQGLWDCRLTYPQYANIVRASGNGSTPPKAFMSMLSHYHFKYGINLTTNNLHSLRSESLLI